VRSLWDVAIVHLKIVCLNAGFECSKRRDARRKTKRPLRIGEAFLNSKSERSRELNYCCGFGCPGVAGFGAADFPGGVDFAAPAFTG
jgi:hypothetical protein